MANDKVSVLTFHKEDVSAASWRHFRDVLSNTLDGGVHNLIVVMEDIHIVFSGVLNALAESRVKARKLGGTIVLVVTSPELHRFLITTGFEKMFDIVSSIEEADEIIEKTAS